jgi:hypothetical protein
MRTRPASMLETASNNLSNETQPAFFINWPRFTCLLTGSTGDERPS